MSIEQKRQPIAAAIALSLAGELWPTLRLAADGAPAPSAEVGINVKTNDNREEQP